MVDDNNDTMIDVIIYGLMNKDYVVAWSECLSIAGINANEVYPRIYKIFWYIKLWFKDFDIFKWLWWL